MEPGSSCPKIPELVYQICELNVDDVLIHGRDIDTFLDISSNMRKVFERLRDFNVDINPAKTKLGLAEVECVETKAGSGNRDDLH